MHWSTELAQEPEQVEERWSGRPLAATLLRLAIFATPIAASIAASAVFSRLLPSPQDLYSLVAWWAALLVVSTIVLVVVDKAMRRLMPLAVLLRLSMLFPGPAPSRFSVARGTSMRTLERRMEKARTKGFADEPTRAAAVILSLVSALSVHDRRTRGHAERVAMYADMMAAHLKLDQPARDRLRWAAMLHDIGKLKVPSSLLNKAGKPTPHEWVKIKMHPHEGDVLVRPIQGWLGEWGLAIPEHHERWDGGGYPSGLRGKDISLAARLVAVVDAYEVMTTARSYKKPISPAAARRELTDHAGTQFDPTMVRAFLELPLGRLNWLMGPLSWLAQIPFVPAYRPLLPVATPLSATVTQVATAGTLAMTPIAALPPAIPSVAETVQIVESVQAEEAEAAEAANDSKKARADKRRHDGKARAAQAQDRGAQGGKKSGAQGRSADHRQDGEHRKDGQHRKDGDRGRSDERGRSEGRRQDGEHRQDGERAHNGQGGKSGEHAKPDAMSKPLTNPGDQADTTRPDEGDQNVAEPPPAAPAPPRQGAAPDKADTAVTAPADKAKPTAPGATTSKPAPSKLSTPPASDS